MRAAILKEELENTAGLDPLEDRFRVGYLKAVSDILNTSVEDLEE